MSIDSNSQCVRSKYFVGKTAMDESLSDFQETKRNCKGPKTTQKVTKPKVKKATKRIKGQKDIRSALKSKNNELLTYTKEFDTVCKKSGLDVDSEQLQLAIALSKSLQTEPSDASTSHSLSTQGRIAKIRTTLQEYGFKVPETKINTVNKRIKKQRKHYKLLNTTDEEKHQKITSKYSQILFEGPDCCLRNNQNSCNLDVVAPIYNIATNLQYEYMKDNNIFYVNNLVEKSNTNGCLFRDWSEIPGRPISPILFDVNKMDFSEIMCSQDELDVILSGHLKSAQNIIECKRIKNLEHMDAHLPELKEKSRPAKVHCSPDTVFDDNSIIIVNEIHVNKEVESKTLDEEAGDKDVEVIELESNSTTVREQYRSCSPDIFEDEVSCIMVISKPAILSQGQKTNLFTEDTNNMDLTECAYKILSQNTVKTSQDVTKRKSNDFMEITNCAVSASQGIRDNDKEIDLTQNSDENSIIIETTHNKNGILNYVAESPDHSLNNTNEVITDGDIENEFVQVDIDLTQNYNKITLEHVDNYKETQPLLSDDIDLTQSSNEDPHFVTREEKSKREDKHESMDLTQSSKSSIDSDDLPEVIIDTQKSQDLDDTIILNPEDYLKTNNNVKKSVNQHNQVYDLTQANDFVEQPNKKESTVCSQSFYEDFIHNHSNSKENLDNIELCGDISSDHNASNDIDLTQSSGESVDISISKPVIEAANNSIGKRDEISIDYDEICEYVSDKENNSEKVDKDSLNLSANNDISNASQNSQIFDLKDTEFEYSIHQSRYEVDNYNYGSISAVDDIIGERSLKNDNITLGDSLLPEVYIKKPEEEHKEEELKNSNVDPGPSCSRIISVYTPKNNEYIIKTKDVTPMADYASMTTPQRNRELDKYGLKPFKRKRAIQILTHIYNQTHPVIEPCSDDEHPSPKRPRHFTSPKKHSPQKRTNTNSKFPKNTNEIDRNINSPKKRTIRNSESPKSANEINRNINSPNKRTIRNLKSPKKCSEINRNLNSPMKEKNSSKENVFCSYEVSEIPIIRGLDCHPDDWVFQKREKAKVHSCRVPLHIAFHNYVSSRRGLREAILKYDPVNIDDIHKDLVSYGHRYDPKDLLRFLDKKCITVKTADNNARNKR